MGTVERSLTEVCNYSSVACLMAVTAWWIPSPYYHVARRSLIVTLAIVSPLGSGLHYRGPLFVESPSHSTGLAMGFHQITLDKGVIFVYITKPKPLETRTIKGCFLLSANN